MNVNRRQNQIINLNVPQPNPLGVQQNPRGAQQNSEENGPPEAGQAAMGAGRFLKCFILGALACGGGFATASVISNTEKNLVLPGPLDCNNLSLDSFHEMNLMQCDIYAIRNKLEKKFGFSLEGPNATAWEDYIQKINGDAFNEVINEDLKERCSSEKWNSTKLNESIEFNFCSDLKNELQDRSELNVNASVHPATISQP